MSGSCPKVLFATERSEDAHKISALLESLGYDAIMDPSMLADDVFEIAVAAATRRYRLSPRERDVLLELLRGLERPEIAKSLGISDATVKWHLHNLYSKLDVDHRTDALRRTLWLEDGRWLRKPLVNREALLLLISACERFVTGRFNRDLSATQLAHSLDEAKQLAGLEVPHD